MARQHKSYRQTYSTDFAQQEANIARLLIGVSDKPDEWGGLERIILSSHYKERLFMSPAAGRLSGRGAAIQEYVTQEKLLDGAKIDRKSIADLAAGKPITLLQCIKINRALELIAENYPEARRKGVPIADEWVLPEKSIVASVYWCNREGINDLRKHLNLTHTDLDEVALGVDKSLFRYIHEGFRDKDGKRFDYRVSRFTADRIWYALSAILHYFPSKQVSPFSSLPPQEWYFDARWNVRKQRRARALPFEHGNQSDAGSRADFEGIRHRAERLGRSKGESAAKKFVAELPMRGPGDPGG